jgi:transcriptional regulator with XRE-family HTH domain
MVKLTRLRTLRERAALTQQELAERAGVSRSTVLRLESGQDEPFPRTARRLARALKVKTSDLMEPLPD